MAVLKDYAVYAIEYGRVVDSRDRAVPDVIAVGLAQLSNGTSTNPIKDFKEQFERLRERRKLTPIFDDEAFQGEDHRIPPVLVPEPSTGNQASSEGTNSPMEDEEDGEESNSADANQDDLDPDLESQLIASPTLERVDEDDVALDMDEWVLDGESDEEISDDSEEEEGEEDEIDVD